MAEIIAGQEPAGQAGSFQVMLLQIKQSIWNKGWEGRTIVPHAPELSQVGKADNIPEKGPREYHRGKPINITKRAWVWETLIHHLALNLNHISMYVDSKLEQRLFVSERDHRSVSSSTNPNGTSDLDRCAYLAHSFQFSSYLLWGVKVCMAHQNYLLMIQRTLYYGVSVKKRKKCTKLLLERLSTKGSARGIVFRVCLS